MDQLYAPLGAAFGSIEFQLNPPFQNPGLPLGIQLKPPQNAAMQLVCCSSAVVCTFL